MIFKTIRIKEGLAEKKIDLMEKVNLIHSRGNSCGKTTLLRFILYSLGYNIPSTKKIKFEQCEVELHLQSSLIGEVVLLRYSQDFIEVNIKNKTQTYVLPNQLYELHSMFFGTDNIDILKNIMGVFYVDQEKGWTLLNRGVVIGSNHFNIEELVRGLAGRNCQNLVLKEAKILRELSKYKQIFSIAQYKQKLEEEGGELVVDSFHLQSM